jgi:hypothetical protein
MKLVLLDSKFCDISRENVEQNSSISFGSVSFDY